MSRKTLDARLTDLAAAAAEVERAHARLATLMDAAYQGGASYEVVAATLAPHAGSFRVPGSGAGVFKALQRRWAAAS